jgi:excisionase family DNA binding protein
MAAPIPATSERYLRLSEASSITALSRSTLLRLISTGKGPPTCRLGRQTLRLPESGLHRWMASKQEAA